MRPIPLAPSLWEFDPQAWPDDDCVAFGADLAPQTLIEAYRHGAFPMPHGGELLWWSPVRRGVLTAQDLHISRSLRRSMRRFRVSFDQAFDEVVRGCAEPSRPGAWIDDNMRAAYGLLHRLGWAHSVEVWADSELVGGLYGIAIGKLFAGESMFHLQSDASKVALAALMEALGPEALLDVQWQTPHLASLGVVEWDRPRYLEAVSDLTVAALPAIWR